MIAFESTASLRYNGLTFELNRRFAGNLQFRAAYTLGKVVDTVPDATAVVPGNAGDDVKYASNPVDFDADKPSATTTSGIASSRAASTAPMVWRRASTDSGTAS